MDDGSLTIPGTKVASLRHQVSVMFSQGWCNDMHKSVNGQAYCRLWTFVTNLATLSLFQNCEQPKGDFLTQLIVNSFTNIAKPVISGKSLEILSLKLSPPLKEL